jgi:hypothetical protein
MEPVKVIFTVNGSKFECTRPDQLESFLSSGWEVYEEKAPAKKAPSRKTKKKT